MVFPLWNKKTENLVIDTAIDPLPELHEMAKKFLKDLDVRPKNPDKFHGCGWIDGEWVEF